MPSTADKGSKRNTNRERASGEPCPGCQQTLPVRTKRPNEVATHWECTGCRTTLTGVLIRNAVPRMAAHIRLSQKHFDTTGMPAIPAEMQELVAEFLLCRANQTEPMNDRRTAVRVPQQLDVFVAPLNDDWIPQGKPLSGIVVDL